MILRRAVKTPSVQRRGAARLKGVPSEPESDTITAESIAVQVITDNQDLARQFATGDLTVLGILQDKALALAAGRLNEHDVRDTLERKLGASI